MLRATQILALISLPLFLTYAQEQEDFYMNEVWQNYAILDPAQHSELGKACVDRLDEIYQKNQDILETLSCSMNPNTADCMTAMGLSAVAAVAYLKNRAAAHATDLNGVRPCGVGSLPWLIPEAYAASGFCDLDRGRLRQVSRQASDELTELAVEQNRALMEAVDDIPNSGTTSPRQIMQAQMGNTSIRLRLEQELIQADQSMRNLQKKITDLSGKTDTASKELVEAHKNRLRRMIDDTASGARQSGRKGAEVARRLGIAQRNSELLLRMIAEPNSANNPKNMAKVVNSLIDEGFIEGQRVPVGGGDVGPQARAALNQATSNYDDALKSYREALAKYRANSSPNAREALKKAERNFASARASRSRMFHSISPAQLEALNMPRELRASFDNVYELERNLNRIEDARVAQIQMQSKLDRLAFDRGDDAARKLRLFAIADQMADIPTASEGTARKLRQVAVGISRQIDYDDIRVQNAATREFNRLPIQERNNTSARSARNLETRTRTMERMARQRSSVVAGKMSKIGISRVAAGRVLGGLGTFVLGPHAFAAEIGIELTAELLASDIGCADGPHPFVTDQHTGGLTATCKPIVQLDDKYIRFASLPKEDLKVALQTFPEMCEIADQVHAEAVPPWKATCTDGGISAERDDGLKYRVKLNSKGDPSLVTIRSPKPSFRGEGVHALRINDGEVTSALLPTVVGQQRNLSFNVARNVYNEVPASRFDRFEIAQQYSDEYAGNLSTVVGMANCCNATDPKMSDADCKRRFGIESVGASSGSNRQETGRGNQ